MSTPNSAMAAFLKDTVNLPQASLDSLETHINGLWTALTTGDRLPDLPLDWHQQGSWAYSTIIKPLPGGEFDADVVLEFEDLDIEPKEYLLRIKKALDNHATYAGKATLKTRCVRVQYAGEHHVDLVPMTSQYGLHYIVNRTDNKLERAEPLEYVEWFNKRDAWSGSQLHKVVRLIKYLRDYKGTHATKSVILTTLLGNQVREGDDFPTTIAALQELSERLASHLELYYSKPSLPDPSCPGQTFDHRWTQQQFETLRTVMRSIANRVADADAATTAASATTRWRELFGSDFPSITSLPVVTASARARVPGEQTPEEVFAAVRPVYTASIRAIVRGNGRRKPRPLGSRVDRNRTLEFTVQTDAPEEYEVHWKVVNRGSEAANAGNLRGDIFLDGRVHTETTLYRGTHTVEAYIVRGRVVVARAFQRVTIR